MRTFPRSHDDHRFQKSGRRQPRFAHRERPGPATAAREAFLKECEALRVAIRAFHMEGIRFRMFNVDRMINRETVALADDARQAFSDVRRHLEAAGFHTRSHQAPS